MGAGNWKSWWSTWLSISLIGAVLYGALIVLIILAPPISNTMRAKPSAPEFAFARWTICDAAAGELASQAMRVPGGVIVRTADAHGADTVLVPIWRYREAERFLAELGCRLPDAGEREP